MVSTRPPATSVAAPPPPVRTPSGALRRPRRPRFDPRVVTGAVALGLGLLGTALFWTRVTAGEPVLVATRTLAAGERIGAADVAVARVRVADRELTAAWVAAGERDRVVGQTLAAPVQARQVLVRAQLGGRALLGPDRVAFTIPVSADTAAGGQIRPGDTVAIYATWKRGQAESRTQEVLADVAVHEVGYGDRGAVLGRAAGAGAAETAGLVPGRGGSSRAPAWLTLAVTREQAAALAQARWNSELDVALVPPGASSPVGPAAETPPVTTGVAAPRTASAGERTGSVG